MRHDYDYVYVLYGYRLHDIDIGFFGVRLPEWATEIGSKSLFTSGGPWWNSHPHCILHHGLQCPCSNLTMQNDDLFSFPSIVGIIRFIYFICYSVLPLTVQYCMSTNKIKNCRKWQTPGNLWLITENDKPLEIYVQRLMSLPRHFQL